MNKYITLFFGVISFLCVTCCFAQSQPVTTGGSLSDHMVLIQHDINKRAAEVRITGTPYLADSFKSSVVYTRKAVFKDIPLRYNIYNDYIEFLQKDFTYILDPRRDVIKIETGEQVLQVEPYYAEGQMKLGFFLVLDTGTIKLLKKRTIRLQEASPAKPYKDAVPAEYIQEKDVFYFRLPSDVAKPIKNLKTLVTELPDDQEKLTDFISNQKLKTNEQDLKLLWTYLNKLKKQHE